MLKNKKHVWWIFFSVLIGLNACGGRLQNPEDIGLVDTTKNPSDTILDSTHTLILPIDTASDSADTIILPIDTTSDSTDTIILPIDTASDSADTIILPIDTTSDSTDTIILPIDTSRDQLELFVPLYSYPTDVDGNGDLYWDKVATAASKVSVTAVVGVIGDPVTTPSQDYIDGFQKLRNAGVRILAYVATGDGHRSWSEMQSEIDHYDANFDIDGIFFDETSGDSANYGFYTNVISYAKAKSNVKSIMVNSPYIDSWYLDSLDVDYGLIYENEYLYWDQFDLSDFDFGTTGTACLNHTVTRVDDMHLIVDRAFTKGVQFVYVTDLEYDALPTYFDEEVDYLKIVNAQ